MKRKLVITNKLWFYILVIADTFLMGMGIYQIVKGGWFILIGIVLLIYSFITHFINWRLNVIVSDGGIVK